MRARSAQKATARPVIAARAERVRLIDQSWPMMRGRVAPMARRTAISLTRPEPRTKQEIGEVGASDQQDCASGGHQHPQWSGKAGGACRNAPWEPGKTSIQHFRNSSRSYFEAWAKAGS